MEINSITTLITIFIILSLIIICISSKLLATRPKSIFAIWLALAISTTTISSVLIVGMTHGMDPLRVNFTTAIKHIPVTPMQDNLPDDVKGEIIIYYRFECQDCANIYKEVKTALEDQPNVYWIESRSKQGQRLLESYPVEMVPAIIYIHKQSKLHTTEYMTDEDGNFNKNSIERIFKLQEKGL